jgi:hypothetical protein
LSRTPIERRAAPRAAADFPLRLSPNAKAGPARLRDISANGLCCDYGEAVAEMTVMGVQVELPESGAHELRGVVVRCEKRRGVNPPTYEVAIYFTEMAPRTRQAIGAFVAAQLRAGVAKG